MRELITDIRSIWDYLEDRQDIVPTLRRFRCALFHRARLIRDEVHDGIASHECSSCKTGWWLVLSDRCPTPTAPPRPERGRED